MSLTSQETTQLVLDYQVRKVSFDELFHHLELLMHDCYWKMTSREKVTQMRIMEEVVYDPFTIVEEQEFLELVKAEMKALKFEPEVRTSIWIHLTTGEPLMRVGARYHISQSIASRRFVKLKKALHERLSAEWCA